MLDWLEKNLHMAYRQTWSLRQAGVLLTRAFRSLFAPAKALACLLAAVQMVGFCLFAIPMPATGQTLDLSGYSPVFFDDFEGDALDTDAWYYRGSAEYSPDQVAVRDGNAVITAEYRDGVAGERWYAGEIALRQKYRQGYFETRCICNEGGGFWSAFWIQADHPYDHDLSRGGIGGAELDIFEAGRYDEPLRIQRNAVTQTIHCNGWDDDRDRIDSRMLGVFRGNDIYHTYNTYGLEWTEDEYIFYINGVETCRSTFAAGVSQEMETVILSLCIPNEVTFTPGQTTQFLVDYVKIYQK